MIKTLSVRTSKHREVIDITDLIEQELSKSGVKRGICHCFVTHTTCALATADLDPGTDLDMLDAFEHLIPKLKFRHPHDPEHAPEHILSTLIGASVMVPIEDRRLMLGTWQRVVLFEFSGPRERTINLSVVKNV